MSQNPSDELASALDQHGFAGLSLGARRNLESFVAQVRALDVSPLLVEVLADPTQPDVARLRAFGRLAALREVASRRPTVRPAA